MSALIEIGGIAIAVDADGRYCLNDLHKAAGSERRHGPALWLENQQTRELVDELSDTGIPVSVIKGGSLQGTFVCKELVYAYAMWISAKFHLQVIRKFDALTRGEIPARASALEPTKEFKALLGVAKLIGLDKNAAVISANQAVAKLTGTNLLGLLGQTHLEQEEQVQYFTPTELGARLKVSGQKVNAMLAAAGLQAKSGKVWELLTAGRQYAMIYDTGKKHSDGVPVQQVKWSASVLDALAPAGA